MILYTTMPFEVVFQEVQDSAGHIENFYVNGVLVSAVLQNDGFRILRINSTNPNAFICGGLQPGTVLPFTKMIGQDI